MVARFILSFDCEGKWGVADHLTPQLHQHLSDASLTRAYRELVTVLDEYAIEATFAFVGCYAITSAQLDASLPQLRGLAQHFPDYLGPVLADYTEGSREGWVGDWAVDMIANAASKHELGLHGITHVPWNHPAMNEARAREELALAYDAGFAIAARATTYIYPRNAVAYTHLLAERGIMAYREAKPRGSRITSLLSEFDLFTKPEADIPCVTAPMPIPAGHFINWRHGLRKLVPVEVTRQRARAMLQRAVKTNGVVHYWMHPENLASAPSTMQVLKAILDEVRTLRDAGKCEVLTQDAYYQRLRS